jgi:hypothetical protein
MFSFLKSAEKSSNITKFQQPSFYPPSFFVINYNESGTSAGEYRDIKRKIMDSLKDSKGNLLYDIVCVNTQESNSGTKNHMQHSLVADMEKIGYEPLMKVDGTRKNNTSMFAFRDEDKFMGVRTRFYILKTINKQDSIKNLYKESYVSPSNFENTYNSGILNTIENNTGKIQIKRIQYIRLSEEDESKRKAGDSSIIISIIIQKDNVLYRYIICNYHSNEINNTNKINKLKAMAKNDINNNNNLKPHYTFLSFVSQDIIKFKFIDNTNTSNNQSSKNQSYNINNIPKNIPKNISKKKSYKIFFSQIFRPNYIPIKIKLLIKSIIDNLLKGKAWGLGEVSTAFKNFSYYFTILPNQNKKGFPKDIILKNMDELYSINKFINFGQNKILLIDDIGNICEEFKKVKNYNQSFSMRLSNVEQDKINEFFKKFYKMYIPITFSNPVNDKEFTFFQDQIKEYIERIVLYWRSSTANPFTKDYINSLLLFTQPNIYQFIKDKCIKYNKIISDYNLNNLINPNIQKLIEMWIKLDSIYISSSTQKDINDFFRTFTF